MSRVYLLRLMILLALLLWLVALLALAAAVAFYRWARVSSGWHRFYMALLVPLTVLVALFSLGLGAVGPPIVLLTLSALLIELAWAWKLNLFVARWLDERLSGGKEIFTLLYNAPRKKRRDPQPPDEMPKA